MRRIRRALLNRLMQPPRRGWGAPGWTDPIPVYTRIEVSTPVYFGKRWDYVEIGGHVSQIRHFAGITEIRARND